MPSATVDARGPRRALLAGVPASLRGGVAQRNANLHGGSRTRVLAPKLHALTLERALLPAPLRVDEPSAGTSVRGRLGRRVAAHTADAADLRPIGAEEQRERAARGALVGGGARRRPRVGAHDSREPPVLRRDRERLVARERHGLRRIDDLSRHVARRSGFEHDDLGGFGNADDPTRSRETLLRTVVCSSLALQHDPRTEFAAPQPLPVERRQPALRGALRERREALTARRAVELEQLVGRRDSRRRISGGKWSAAVTHSSSCVRPFSTSRPIGTNAISGECRATSRLMHTRVPR